MSQVIIHNLKNFMQMRAVNSRELAKRAQVRPSFIYDILSGKSANPSSVKLSKVAQALSVTLSDLVEKPLTIQEEPPRAAKPAFTAFAGSRESAHSPWAQHPIMAGELEEIAAQKADFNAAWPEQHSLAEEDAPFFMHEINNDAMAPT